MKKRLDVPKKKEQAVEQLGLPKDVCLGALRVTLTGSREAWIENYKGLLEYTGETILLQGRTGQVRFEGRGLFIEYYTCEDMRLKGHISCVKFL